MSRSSSTSPAASQPGLMDIQFESLIDFSEYDNNAASYQSPSLSPAASKTSFARPATKPETSAAASVLPPSQPMTGPSHQYDLYKQQTGIVPGALASTLAVNQNNPQIQGYSSFNLDYLGIGNTEELFDFNVDPSQASVNASDLDMDFESPSEQFFFAESTVNPSSIGGQEPTSLPSPPVMPQTSSVGRLWPGMHQQAALAKAQAQQRQQQQIIQQQQQQQRQNAQSQPKPQRAKSAQPTDPLVEEKITQLLNSMRAKTASSDDGQGSPLMNMPRLKKPEEDMDDDERLLASEEGKKLTSKERRQLRNKVSARAFRSRRKEYISQLESEIATKVTENGDLRTQNRALVEENKRLSDLTRMLLSSPSFSDFLDRLSSNPQQAPAAQPQQPQQQQQQQQQPAESRQVPKDVNPYTAQNHLQQQQHIGMAMIPEQPMDLSLLAANGSDMFGFQPQVYAVLETPEPPVIDTSLLSGKTSNFIGASHDVDEEKVDMPVIDRPKAAMVESRPEEEKAQDEACVSTYVDEAFESDPAFALYHDAPSAVVSEAAVVQPTATAELDTEALSHVDIFGGIESEKMLARLELVEADADAEEAEEQSAALAMALVQHISASLESTMARLDMLTRCD